MAQKKKAAPRSSLKTHTFEQADDSALTLHQSRGEPRVDSRLIAGQLKIQHESVIKTLTSYADDFRALGILRFEIGEIEGRGQPEKYALLNEDQAYLALAYSRNTARVRSLKLKLVKAFKEARDRKALVETAYLPGYRSLHDEVMLLANAAHAQGSVADDAVFHLNANRMVNQAAGIASGMRQKLSEAERLMVVNLQTVVRNALHQALQSGADYREAYRQAKRASETFAKIAGRLLRGV